MPARPACGDSGGSTRDRKWFHTLIECQRCLLLYRFPVESPQAMSDCYDVGYSDCHPSQWLEVFEFRHPLLTLAVHRLKFDRTWHPMVVEPSDEDPHATAMGRAGSPSPSSF